MERVKPADLDPGDVLLEVGGWARPRVVAVEETANGGPYRIVVGYRVEAHERYSSIMASRGSLWAVEHEPEPLDERLTWSPPGMVEVTEAEYESAPGGLDRCVYAYLPSKIHSFHHSRYFLPENWKDQP